MKLGSSVGFATTALVLHAGFGPGLVFHIGLICAGVGQGFLQPSTVRQTENDHGDRFTTAKQA
jgi:hypothetical protein